MESSIGPAGLVDSGLLSLHVAVCTSLFPRIQALPSTALITYLLSIPKLAQELSFGWELLNQPPIGTLLLVWSPTKEFPPDGYVWEEEQEISKQVLIQGYAVEVSVQNCGSTPGAAQANWANHEPFARRRFRLTGADTPISRLHKHLWLVHYGQPEPQTRLNIGNFVITPHTRARFHFRREVELLYETGRLAKSPEFKLHDPNDWPMLSIPGQHPQQHPQQQQQAFPPQMQQQPGLMHHPQTPQQNRHISPVNARTTPQPPHHQIQASGGPPPPHHLQAAYYNTPTGTRPPQMPPGAAPPSAKRYKQSPANAPHPSHAAAAAQAAALGAVGGDPVMTIEEEEDTSRGDILDHFSPREIAQTRYTQHHEWMEEVIGSAYPINRIMPVGLGLGLAGELEKVTQGILDPPVFPAPKAKVNDPVKEPKDESKQLSMLQERANRAVAEAEAEMEQMRATHKKRMDQIRATSIYRDAELELRGGLGIEHLIPGFNLPNPLEGESDSEEASTTAAASARPASPAQPKRTVAEIWRDVERLAGRKIVGVQSVVKYELHADEIVKMGGVFAQDMQQHHHHHHHTDAAMQGEHSHVCALDDDSAFKLDIPTPPTESPMLEQNDLTNPTPEGLLEEFRSAHEDGSMGGMEDTIMADFMNVDDISKPGTPQGGGEHHLTSVTAAMNATDASGSVGAVSSAGEELFTIPPLEGTTPSVVGTPGLDLIGIGQ